MNKLNTRTDINTIKHRYGLYAIVALTGLSLLTLVVYNLSQPATTHSISQNDSPSKIRQYAVLSTTNAILKNYLVDEGDFVNKSSTIAILIDSHFEAQLQKANQNVSQARLTLQEKRIENIANARKTDPYTNKTSLQNRIKTKQTKNQIIRQQETVRNLTSILATLNATLVELNSPPFQQNGNQNAIRSTKSDITKFESKLDMENVELKQLQSEVETDLAQANPTSLHKTTASNRSIIIAENNLRYEENILREIQNKTSQLSTIIHAPFSGLIIETRIPEGSYAREGQSILIMTKQDYPHAKPSR